MTTEEYPDFHGDTPIDYSHLKVEEHCKCGTSCKCKKDCDCETCGCIACSPVQPCGCKWNECQCNSK